MNKKLYVGNLNYSTTEDELRKLFSEAGTVVSVSVITDRATGQSKGFGFVEMETDQGAEAAIERFNNFELNRRNLTVNEARPPRERSDRPFGGGGGGGGRRPDRGGSGGGDRGGWDRDRGGDRGDRGRSPRSGGSGGGGRRGF